MSVIRRGEKMAKEAYYFSHDSNARQDPKILAMRSVYKSEGYGWYWIIIEMMREQSGYTLDIQSKYIWNAFALEMQCEAEKAQEFITECVSEFKLFQSDGERIWSESLLRRMKIKEQKSEKARQSALARWQNSSNQSSTNEEKDNRNANAMRTQCERNAIKGNEIEKKKEKKNKYAEYVSLSESEYQKLINTYGEQSTKQMIEALDNYKGANGKKYASDYRAILNWVVEKVQKQDSKGREPKLIT